MRRRFILAVLLSALVLATNAVAEPKVVILGFDGADSRLVEQWMDAGELPNLAALREEGSYAPLLPTNPPQTPVSWSSFATGLNPGKTEIFDFLKREPRDYLPDFAMNSESRKPLGFGPKNGAAAGTIVGIVALVLVIGVLCLFRMQWKTRFAIGVLFAVAAALPVGSMVHRYLPEEVPDAVNHRKGLTMWELATRAGLEVQVIRVPATFPAEPVGDGHMISGLGVPDMRGRIGTPSFYTSDPTFQPGGGDNEFSLELLRLPERRGTIETRIIGPYNKPFYDYVVDERTRDIDNPAERNEAKRKVRQELDDAGVPRRIDLPLTLEVTDTSCAVTASGKTETLRVGEWSDWFVLDFPVNWLVDVASPLRGMSRFKLLALEPEIELYMSPINFHPDCHPVAYTWPPSYSEELAKRFGLYKTIGWPEDTWSLPSGVGDESLFLEDMQFTVEKDAEIMEGLLGDGEADLFIQIFYFTDRIGHLFWRFLDEGHPLYDPEKAARYVPEVLRAYKKMDELVGRARNVAGKDAVFMVCSDHGFSSFRRGVNYNNWLRENGFLVLEGDAQRATLEKLFDTRELLQGVDWSRTRAYAIGLGSIYINLMGRESKGIVAPGAEYLEVRRQIKEGLESLVDDATGQRPISRVWTREEIYSGFDEDLIPDLRVGNNLDYRVSWQTSLGGFGVEVIEDNNKAWSGDHCSNDPEQVRGIFFCSRKINTSNPTMVDIMPTVLEILGIEIPADVDGRPLL